MAEYDERGREIPDPRPVEMPLGLRRPKTLNEIVGEIVARQIREEAANLEAESFEEADDFDVGEEDDWIQSPHEMSEDQEAYRVPDEPNAGDSGAGGKAGASSNVDPAKPADSGGSKDPAAVPTEETKRSVEQKGKGE